MILEPCVAHREKQLHEFTLKHRHLPTVRLESEPTTTKSLCFRVAALVGVGTFVTARFVVDRKSLPRPLPQNACAACPAAPNVDRSLPNPSRSPTPPRWSLLALPLISPSQSTHHAAVIYYDAVTVRGVSRVVLFIVRPNEREVRGSCFVILAAPHPAPLTNRVRDDGSSENDRRSRSLSPSLQPSPKATALPKRGFAWDSEPVVIEVVAVARESDKSN